jgi:hypothetical protein
VACFPAGRTIEPRTRPTQRALARNQELAGRPRLGVRGRLGAPHARPENRWRACPNLSAVRQWHPTSKGRRGAGCPDSARRMQSLVEQTWRCWPMPVARPAYER